MLDHRAAVDHRATLTGPAGLPGDTRDPRHRLAGLLDAGTFRPLADGERTGVVAGTGSGGFVSVESLHGVGSVFAAMTPRAARAAGLGSARPAAGGAPTARRWPTSSSCPSGPVFVAGPDVVRSVPR